MKRLSTLFVVALLGLTALAADREPLIPSNSKAFAISGALIRTQTDQGDFVGSIVVADGKIQAMGPDVPIPNTAKVIDGKGWVVTPGLIDAHGSLWLNPAAGKEGGGSGNLNILDAIDPYSDHWKDAAAQGVTAVYVQPGSGSFAGSGAALRVAPKQSVAEITLKPVAGAQSSLVAAQPGNTLSRFAAAEGLKGQLSAGKQYAEAKPAKREAPKELMAKVIRKEIPLRVEVGHEDDAKNVLKFTNDFGIRPVFEGLDRSKTAPEGRYAAVLGPFVSAGRRPDRSDLRKQLTDGNRTFAIGTFGDDPRGTAGLRLQAAAAVAEGYPRDRVLRALTRSAAEILGVEDRLGSLATGRVADLAVFAGDPLDPSVPAILVLSQGEIVHQGLAADSKPATTTASAEIPKSFPASYVLKTKRLLNETGAYAPGELIIDNGRVVATGNANWPTFDLGDTIVTPGLVAGHATLAPGEVTDGDSAQVRAIDAIGPDSTALRYFRDNGFLTIIVAPSSDTTIPGLASVVKLTAAGASPGPAVGMKFVLGPSARKEDRFPATLGGQIEFIDDRLHGKASTTRVFLPPSVESALLNQREKALQPVRGGQQAAMFDAQSRAEIAAALRLIGEHKLRGVLVAPKQIDDLANDIRESKSGVIVGSIRPQDGPLLRKGIIELGRAGVPLAFGSGSPAEIRATASWLVNGGMDRNAARRALVGRAGESLGLPAGTGRLASGDSADFIIWSGCPLDSSSRPLAVFAAGKKLGSQ